MKVVINGCYGGFSLSHKAFLKLREMKNKHALEEPDYEEPYGDGSTRGTWGIDKVGFFLRDIPRDDKDLLEVIELLGEEANGECARLEIVEVPDGVEWEIDEYDGNEHVAEKHRTWR